MTTHITQRGYITLITMLVVGAVGLSITTALLLQGVGVSQATFVLQQSAQARAAADACAEEAVQHINDATNYTGTDALTFAQSSCTFVVTNTGGTTRRVEATGVSQSTTRRVLVLVASLNPKIILSSWQEVAGF